MTENQPPRPEGEFQRYAGFAGEDRLDGGQRRRRRLARYGVPVAVAGVAAATIGIGTALATTSGGPALPKRTARQLLTTMAASHVQHMTGSVRITTDLGLPAALTGAVGGAADSLGGAAHGTASGRSSADPRTKLTELLSGTHTLRVAVDGPNRQRFSLVDATSEYSVIHDGGQLWAYDSSTNSVYHATAPVGAAGKRAAHGTGKAAPQGVPALTPGDVAAQVLKAAGPTTSITVDGTAEVAGQDAYDLLVTPKQSGSTIGAIRIAVDAANGTPLAVTLTPAAGGAPVVDIAYTRVDFGTPAASEFTFTVPKGAHVTQAAPNGRSGKASGKAPGTAPGKASGAGSDAASGHTVIGQGWTAIAELRAPDHPGAKGAKGSADAAGVLADLGKPVKGAFGSGTVIGTRLVNVLITHDGAVFAGAVTPAELVKAADAAAAHAK
jgi:outer membrane lipoprotein-sorting protein